MFHDRLPHLPAPAAAAMAEAICDVAGLRRWTAWPDTVELDGTTVELPGALRAVIDDIRRELAADLESTDVGAAEVPVLRAIADHLVRFPPPDAADMA